MQEGGFAGNLVSEDGKAFFYNGSFQVQQRMVTYAFVETVESFCACRNVSFCKYPARKGKVIATEHKEYVYVERQEEGAQRRSNI